MAKIEIAFQPPWRLRESLGSAVNARPWLTSAFLPRGVAYAAAAQNQRRHPDQKYQDEGGEQVVILEDYL